MMPIGGGGPSEPEPVDCPLCGAHVVREDIHKCEQCTEVGCEECMVRSIDGWCCTEDCAAALKKEQDDIDRYWAKRIGRMKGGVE